MLRVEGVAHRYPTQNGMVEALAPIHLEIPNGAFVCIVGPSGCGKTTLLHIMAGLISPSEGHVTLDGDPVSAVQRRVGTVFQKSNLMPWRTVTDNLALPLQLAGTPRPTIQAKVGAMLDLLGLTGFENAFPAELSGGMAQRVAIGRALIYDPEVLLLDEPFGALDAMAREQMQVELMRIWANARKTAIMVTHSITEAVFVADVVVVMSPRPGHIRAQIPIALTKPRSLEVVHEPSFGVLARQIRSILNIRG